MVAPTIEFQGHWGMAILAKQKGEELRQLQDKCHFSPHATSENLVTGPELTAGMAAECTPRNKGRRWLGHVSALPRHHVAFQVILSKCRRAMAFKGFSWPRGPSKNAGSFFCFYTCVLYCRELHLKTRMSSTFHKLQDN